MDDREWKALAVTVADGDSTPGAEQHNEGDNCEANVKDEMSADGCKVLASGLDSKEEGNRSITPDLDDSLEDKNFTDFSLFGGKKRSLLEYCRDTDLTEQKLRVILKKELFTGDVDQVDKDFAAIHYLITKKLRNRPALLEALVVMGGANVDISTTQYQYTALHLAVKHSDFESVEVLVALDANVNCEDYMKNTPLDIANLQTSLKKSKDFGFKLSRLNSQNEFEESVAGVETTSALAEKESQSLDKIKELLLSVGARPGSSSKNHRHHSHPRSHASTSNSQAFSFKKINTVYYKQVHDEFREWITRSHLSLPPKPGEADTLLKKMAEAEEYRKRCGSRILFLDGGGVRGLVQMAILREIERRTRKKIVELFDWIVGTSTGGIIALALTYGPPNDEGVRQTKSIHQLRDIYWSMKDEVFGATKDGFLGFLARGNTETLEKILQQWLGKETTLEDATFPKVLVPAVSKKLSNLEMHFFNNCFHDEYSKELVWKVARYTSAAPFYFKECDGYIDGGMMANNPSEVGLTAIQNFYHKRGEKLPISLVVSIGSGQNPGAPLGEIDLKSNLLDPKRYADLLSVLAAAVVNWPAHSSCEARCREEGISYFRFNPDLSEKVTSEQHDSKVLQRMILTTRKYIHSMKEHMDDLVTKLKHSDLTSTMTVTD